MIAFSNTETTKAYLGSAEIVKIYLGEDLVFGGSSPTPVLPYDAEVEYLESSGTQGIDTLITPNANTKIQVLVKNLVVTGNGILGYYTNSDSTDYRLFNYNSKVYWDLYSKRIIGGNNSFKANTTYYFELGNNYVKNLFTNTAVVSGDAITFTGQSTIKLNGPINGYSSNRFYSVKIYDGDTLTRDFIPVRVGTTGYMYDKVSGDIFGNTGSGNFTYGNDLPAVPSYDAQIEYIESTGTQYIDTGVNCREIIQCICSFAFSEIPTGINMILGAYWDTSPNVPKIQFYYNSGWKDVSTTNCVTTGNNVTIAQNGTATAGTIYSTLTRTKAAQASDDTVWAFARNNDNNNTYNSNHLRIYSLIILSGDNLVRDFVPVRVGQVGYLYDRVTRTLFGNSGTGNFVLGNDVTN